MKIDLNHKDYIPLSFSSKSRIKCTCCAWVSFPEHYCVKFCRKGYVFRKGVIKSSIFHL